MTSLVLKRASSRSSGEWRDDNYDGLADEIVVGRIMKAIAASEGTPWLWQALTASSRIAGRRTGMRRRPGQRWRSSRRVGGERPR